MSLYGPTFRVTPVDLCIIFPCNLYISCIMSCGNKIVSKLFHCFKLLISIKNYNVFRNDNHLNSREGGASIYVKNIFTCKKYEKIEITDGEPSKGI